MELISNSCNIAISSQICFVFHTSVVHINFNVIFFVLNFNMKCEISKTTFYTVSDHYTSTLHGYCFH
jgi:hypothetical protein